LPRAPDPQLEHRLVTAALHLLDTGGLPGITLRSVAREAHTTTPTIYERFADRDKLLQSVRQEAEMELVAAVGQAHSTGGFIKRLVEFSVQYPHRFELIADAFGFRLAAGQPMPVYELLKEQLSREVGVRGRKREQLATAIVSLALGTTRSMIAAGTGTPAAKELHRTCLAALQLLLKVFSQSSHNDS
jgi:AcrR family transcriptional regulator